MVLITDTIDIDASPQRVYQAIRALDAYPNWLRHSPIYHGTTAHTAPAGARPSYEDATMVGKMRGELVEDVPGRTLKFHQKTTSGSLDANIRYTVDAEGEGTRVTRVGELSTRGPFRIVQPVLVRMAAGETQRTMKALKAYVERSG